MARTYPKHEAKKSALQIPHDIGGRKDFLVAKLSKYKNRTFYCKAIGVSVIVSDKSIQETAFNASASEKSSKLALYLPYIIRNAKIIELHLPTESRKQTRDFHFVDIGVLRCNVPKAGIAKIVIGYRNNGKTIEYSITDYQMQKAIGG